MQPSARHWAAIVIFSNDLTGTLYFIGQYTMITSKDKFKDKKLSSFFWIFKHRTNKIFHLIFSLAAS